MKRKGSLNKLLYFVAVLVFIALVISAGKIIMSRGIIGEADKKDMVKVYVLADKVNADDILCPDMLKEVEVAPDMVPDNCFTSFSGEGSERFRITLQGGLIVTEDMLYNDDSLKDDVRLHNFPYVELSDKIETGDYVDIRIAFPNGCDYIVLSGKKVIDFAYATGEEEISNALWLDVNEEEILRMSGALVDCSLSEGSRIYAIKYKDSMQKPATANYPVSALIEALIESDPNIVAKAADAAVDKNDTKAVRKELEENIENGQGTDAAVEKDGSDKENPDEDAGEDDNLYVYEKPTQDKIVYFG